MSRSVFGANLIKAQGTQYIYNMHLWWILNMIKTHIPLSLYLRV